MYKVFVNELPLILTDVMSEKGSDNVYPLSEKSIFQAIKALERHEIDQATIYHDNAEFLFKTFCAIVPKVVAAGGRVKNAKGKWLFIYRNGKWDLPKGKLDSGESIENAAVREVEEETGVGGLTITNFLAITYHIFQRSGHYKLKEVHWFDMKTDHSKKLVPQLEEGITKVKWKGPRKTRKALTNSYQTIIGLFGP